VLVNQILKLSVIIPTYNRAQTIERALQSVLNQVLPGAIESMEIIVVDDGSTDETRLKLEPFANKIKYLHQQNQGVSVARNRGIEVAAGNWLALLDSDDEWLPNKLLKQFGALESSGLLICHTHETWIRNGVRVNQKHKHQKSGGWIFEQCLPLCAMSPSSILISNKVFEAVGNFDPKLPACEDYDLWLRITAAYEVAYVSEPCINKYGGHADQLSRQYWGMDRFRVRALENILACELQDSQQRAALNMLIEKLNILHAGAIKRQNQELITDCQQKLARYSLMNI